MKISIESYFQVKVQEDSGSPASGMVQIGRKDTWRRQYRRPLNKFFNF